MHNFEHSRFKRVFLLCIHVHTLHGSSRLKRVLMRFKVITFICSAMQTLHNHIFLCYNTLYNNNSTIFKL